MLKKISTIAKGTTCTDLSKELFIFNTEEIVKVRQDNARECTLHFKDKSATTLTIAWEFRVEEFMDFIVNNEVEFKNYGLGDVLRNISGDDDEYFLKIHDLKTTDDFSEYRKSVGDLDICKAVNLYKLLQREGYVKGEIPVVLLKWDKEACRHTRYSKIYEVHEFSSIRKAQYTFDAFEWLGYNTTEQFLWEIECLGEKTVINKFNAYKKKEVEQITKELFENDERK
jgi:hypothetical protein